jgi:peroxiredoxin
MSNPSTRILSRWTVAGAAALALLVSANGAARADETAPGDKSGAAVSVAPDFTAEDLNGQKYQLSKLLEKGPVFLDFWTTWCKPCMVELPELEKLHEKYKDRGFTLLTVASDDQKTLAKVKPLVKQRGWAFPVLVDSKREIGNPYNVRQYPTSYLIGQDRKIVSVHLGYRPGDEAKIEEEILRLLPAAESPAPGGAN